MKGEICVAFGVTRERIVKNFQYFPKGILDNNVKITKYFLHIECRPCTTLSTHFQGVAQNFKINQSQGHYHASYTLRNGLHYGLVIRLSCHNARYSCVPATNHQLWSQTF